MEVGGYVTSFNISYLKLGEASSRQHISPQILSRLVLLKERASSQEFEHNQDPWAELEACGMVWLLEESVLSCNKWRREENMPRAPRIAIFVRQ